MTKPGIAILLLVVAGWLLAGCGGGSSGSTVAVTSNPTSATTAGGSSGKTNGEATGPQLTKAQYIKKGDAICRLGKKKTELEVRINGETFGLGQANGPTKAQEEALLVEIVLPAIQKQAEELGELRPPTSAETQAKAIVDGIEAGVAEGEKTPAKALQAPGVFAEFDRLAKAFGFKVCGQ